MEEKQAVSPAAPLRVAKMSSVEIKIVGESGEMVKSFAGKVDVLIQPHLIGQCCTVSFRDGKSVHVFVHANLFSVLRCISAAVCYRYCQCLVLV